MQSLTTRAATIMVLGLLLALAAQAVVLNHYNRTTVMKLVDDKIKMLVTTQAVSLAAPLWHRDRRQIEDQVAALMREDAVIGVHVIDLRAGDSNTVAVSSGTSYATAPGLKYEIIESDITHAGPGGGEPRKIGAAYFVIDRAPMLKRVTDLTLLSLLTSLLAFGSVLAVSYYALKRAINPVTRLAAVIGRPDAATRSTAEIEEIEANTREVSNLIHGLTRLKEHHFSHQAELIKAKEEAERASLAKTDFLANMSHELRTPLNSIIGLVELMSESKLPHETLESLAVVEISSRNLLHIVNDILDISKIEASNLELETLPFSPYDSLHTIMQMLRPQASARGTIMTEELEFPDNMRVLGDPKRFAQVATNIIGNAIKYTEQGRVRVTARARTTGQDNIELSFEVVDSGIGIEKEKLERIFDKFVQADATITRKYGGSGLGLAITKQLIELMGGRIEVESSAGIGSRFHVTLPFILTQLPVADGRPDMPGRAARENAIPAAEARILVAEDHKMNQIFMKKLLTSLGISKFRIVDNGRDALDAALKADEFDLVLMDCHMPVMSGYDAAIAIRQAETAQDNETHIPIIAMTANALLGERDNCIRCGMDDYISKPVDRKTMVRILSRWLRFSDHIARKNHFEHEDKPITSASLPVIDTDILTESALDSEEMKRELAAIFVTQSAEKIDELEEECIDGVNVRWKEKTHFLKGGAATLGAKRLRQICEDAQLMVDARVEDRRAMFERIRTAYAETLFELKKLGLLD